MDVRILVRKPNRPNCTLSGRTLLSTVVLGVGTSVLHAAALPVLLAVDTIGSDTADFALPADPLLTPVTAIRVRFDRPVLAAIADFRVLAAGSDRRLDTVGCLVPPSGDDADVAIPALQTFGDGSEVAISLSPSSGLPAGNYRLLVCDTLLGAGNLAAREFSIAETPQLPDPGFATDLANWETYRFGPAIVEWSPVDADAALASGSFRIKAENDARVGLFSPHCVQVAHTFAQVPYRIRFRYRVLSGRVRIVAFASTGFPGDMGDAPCIGPGFRHTHIIDLGPSSAEFATYDSGPLTLAVAPHASFGLLVIDADFAKPGYEILLDDVGFTFDPDRIFRSHFDRTDLF
jgi:hypothetical protein